MDPLIPLFVKDQDSEDFDLEAEIYSVAEEIGWSNLLKEIFFVLSRPSRKEFWLQAVSVLYWAVSDSKPLPISLEECLARLYRCLELHPGLGESGINDGENLVWSIASKLKGVSYESSWDPLSEPEVMHRLNLLRTAS